MYEMQFLGGNFVILASFHQGQPLLLSSGCYGVAAILSWKWLVG